MTEKVHFRGSEWQESRYVPQKHQEGEGPVRREGYEGPSLKDLQKGPEFLPPTPCKSQDDFRADTT